MTFGIKRKSWQQMPVQDFGLFGIEQIIELKMTARNIPQQRIVEMDRRHAYCCERFIYVCARPVNYRDAARYRMTNIGSIPEA